MKILVNAEIVVMRKERKYVFYSLGKQRLHTFFHEMEYLSSEKEYTGFRKETGILLKNRFNFFDVR